MPQDSGRVAHSSCIYLSGEHHRSALVDSRTDLGWQIINAPHAVEWNKGDEFESARKSSQSAP